MKSSLDTDPAGRDIILWRNIRDSTIEGSRFSPTVDSAMSERVEIGTCSPCNCLTALCWKREIAVISAFVRLLHNSEP